MLLEGCTSSGQNDALLELDSNNVPPLVVDNSNLKPDTLITPKEKNDSEKTVSLSKKSLTFDIDAGGRSNPFVPYQERNLTYSSLSFGDLPLPPSSGEMDETLSSLVTAKVTGIVYDEDSPSAIINVFEDDYLVKPGDKVESFIIESITKDYVAIRTGLNVFRAKVGDIVDGEVYGTGVYNLGHRFAGIKNPSKDEDILIVEMKKNADNKSNEQKGLNDLELPPIPIQFGDSKITIPSDSIPLPINQGKN